MCMSVLTNKCKIIRYFIKNGIFNEERAIEISKFDHNTIEALVHSQLLVQVDGRVYLDKPFWINHCMTLDTKKNISIMERLYC